MIRVEYLAVAGSISDQSGLVVWCILSVSEAYSRSPWSPPPPPSHNTSCQGRHLHLCHLYYLILRTCLLLQLRAGSVIAYQCVHCAPIGVSYGCYWRAHD